MTFLLLLVVQYREAGFHGPHMMDHTPGFADDADGAKSFVAGKAFANGFIRAAIQAAYRDDIARSVDGLPRYTALAKL
jgi:hypothetical protein